MGPTRISGPEFTKRERKESEGSESLMSVLGIKRKETTHYFSVKNLSQDKLRSGLRGVTR